MIDKQFNCYNGNNKNFKPMQSVLLTVKFGNLMEKLEPVDFYMDTAEPRPAGQRANFSKFRATTFSEN